MRRSTESHQIGALPPLHNLLIPQCNGAEIGPMWYAVYTLPNNEKSLVKHLNIRQIESFLPTWESVRTWKNRQRMKIVQPLFPSYLFVRIRDKERSKVLQSPGAIRIIGNCQGPVSISEREIEFLRSDFCRQRVEPYRELVLGKKVRIKTGPMQGVQGTLVQKRNSMRFVLSIEMINQNAAIEVNGDEIELVLN
ncbi:MAG: UpxY family transcription antiterminator [Acidobacteriaceae bacterium]